MSRFVILDLDNCIADDAWRIPRINWQKQDPLERYHEYHSLSGFDNSWNSDLYDGSHDVIIFTARPVLYRPITEEWLRRHGIGYHHLTMRNTNDLRNSVDLKRAMLHWLPELYGVPWRHIAAAYDDRQDVVDMYRKHHVDAYVRALHDTCAYTPPTQTTAEPKLKAAA